jgi:hypothetical protein
LASAWLAAQSRGRFCQKAREGRPSKKAKPKEKYRRRRLLHSLPVGQPEACENRQPADCNDTESNELRNKDMEYYIFLGHRLARRTGFLNKCEWLINGEWKEDRQRTLALNDALMNYGDYSIFDQDRITPEIAEALIQNGTIVLQGDIGFGTIYREPKTIQFSNWKKPDSPK